jgi:phage FluMu gp28-like protein
MPDTIIPQDSNRLRVRVTTATGAISYNRPKLYPKQLAAMFNPLDIDNQPARYSMIEATTKAGKTVSGMAWLFEQAFILGKPGRNYWWVAPVYAQTKIAFRRMKRAFPQALFHADNQELTITLYHNGATIWFKSGEKPDNLYGEDVYAAVIDEASRVRAEAWHAVRSTLTATRGPVRCIGNVKGKKNWFYTMSRQAESGAPNLSFHKLTAFDAANAGVLAWEEIEDAKGILPEAVFNELYLAIPNDDESNPFGIDHIRACITLKTFSEEHTFAAGVDLARKRNWSVILGLDRYGRMTGIERNRLSWVQQEELVLATTKRCGTLIDATGVGDVFYDRIKEKHPNLEPYIFTNSSKQILMETLAVAIQNREVHLCQHTPAGKALINELENFTYVHTGRGNIVYTAPEGMDDDCVVALALAVYKRARMMPGGMQSANDDLTRVSPWLGNDEEQPDGEA